MRMYVSARKYDGQRNQPLANLYAKVEPRVPDAREGSADVWVEIGCEQYELSGKSARELGEALIQAAETSKPWGPTPKKVTLRIKTKEGQTYTVQDPIDIALEQGEKKINLPVRP